MKEYVIQGINEIWEKFKDDIDGLQDTKAGIWNWICSQDIEHAGDYREYVTNLIN